MKIDSAFLSSVYIIYFFILYQSKPELVCFEGAVLYEETLRPSVPRGCSRQWQINNLISLAFCKTHVRARKTVQKFNILRFKLRKVNLFSRYD